MIYEICMKEKMLPFIFSAGEISVGRFVSNSRNLSIRDLTVLMDKSESSVSQIVKKLEIKGIIESKRNGMKKIVNLSERNYACTFSQMLRAEPNLPWEKILSYSNLAVLISNITGEEAFEDELSSISKWRAIRNLKLYGAYNNSQKRHPMGNRYLSSFLKEYSEHVSLKHIIENIPEDAIMIWRKGFSCLFKIKSNSINGRKKLPDSSIPTAITASPHYGIQYITGDSYYFYEPRLDRLSLEDVILHTLLIDPDSQTYNTYAVLLALKNRNKINFDLLLTKSRKYDLIEKTTNLIDYLKSNGKMRKWPLPKPDELQEQGDLYGVKIN